jgi:hypothetical protein
MWQHHTIEIQSKVVNVAQNPTTTKRRPYAATYIDCTLVHVKLVSESYSQDGREMTRKAPSLCHGYANSAAL